MSFVGRNFYENIAMRGYANIVPWSKVGYTPSLTTAESDIWSKGGLYGNSGLFPAAAVQMEVVGSENTNDIGTIIRGSRTTPITSDAGGSATTLLDADVDFTVGGGTAVDVGDILVLDPSGTVSPNIPEWGYVTTVATHTLTCTGGFSSGGTGTTRKYFVIDASAHIGALALKIDYLDNAFTPYTLIMPTNGTTAVTTLNAAGTALSNLYRINSFRMIGAGTNYRPSGNWQIQTVSGGTIWSYITAGYTRSRNTVYTVPVGKTLYLNEWNVGWSTPNDIKVQTARLYTRANVESSTMFNTGNIFYPYTETIITNSQETIEFSIPTRFPEKTDIKVSGIAFTAGAGAAASILRGFLVY